MKLGKIEITQLVTQLDVSPFPKHLTGALHLENEHLGIGEANFPFFSIKATSHIIAMEQSASPMAHGNHGRQFCGGSTTQLD